MRIISVRHGLQADHSSSTYEFYALERLSPEQRRAIADLTGEQPRGRKLRLHWEGEGELSQEWEDALLTMGYDILISESYDWWAAQLSLPYDEKLAQQLSDLECEYDANGVQIRCAGERLIVYFGFHMDYEAAYEALGENPFAGLADLFEQVRTELLAGDMSVPLVFCELYGDLEEEEGVELPEPSSETAQTLTGIIERF